MRVYVLLKKYFSKIVFLSKKRIVRYYLKKKKIKFEFKIC